MALDARTRSSIYDKLVPLLGDDDANALMTEFPSIEADELVTKQFLRAEMAELRGEFAGLQCEFVGLRTEFAGLQGEFAGLRTEFAGLRTEFAGLRAEFAGLRSEFAGLRTEVGGDVATVRSELHDLRAEMLERFHQQTVWFGGALGAATALLAAIGLLG